MSQSRKFRTITHMLSGCALIALMTYSVPVNATSFAEPLINAADDGRVSTVRKILSEGISVETRGRFGVTALMRAAYGGHERIVDLLIAEGADVNAEDVGGETALHIAARSGKNDTIEALLSAGADVTHKDHEGWTPLMRAVNASHTRAVVSLIDAGSDPSIKNGFGETSYHLASESRDKTVLNAVFSGESLKRFKEDSTLSSEVIRQAKGDNGKLIEQALSGKAIGGNTFGSFFSPVKRTASVLFLGSDNTDSSFPFAISDSSSDAVLVVSETTSSEIDTKADIIASEPVYSEGDPEPQPGKAVISSDIRSHASEKAGLLTDTPPVQKGRSTNGLPVPMLKASSFAVLTNTTVAVAPVPGYADSSKASDSILPIWVRAFSGKIFDRDEQRPGAATRRTSDNTQQVDIAQNTVLSGSDSSGNAARAGGFFSLPFFNRQPAQQEDKIDVDPDANVYYVQFGTFADQREAISTWEAMRTRLPIINEFYPKVVPVYLAAPDSLRFRLRAGVFNNENDADDVCTYFYDKNVDCLVVESAGDKQSETFLRNMSPIEDILRRAGADLPEKPASSKKRRPSGARVVASAEEREITGLPWLKKKSSRGLKARDLPILPVPLFKPKTPTAFAKNNIDQESVVTLENDAPSEKLFAAVLRPSEKVVTRIIPPAPAKPAIPASAKVTELAASGDSERSSFAFIAPSFRTTASTAPRLSKIVVKRPEEPTTTTGSLANRPPSVASKPIETASVATSNQDSSTYMDNYLEYRRKKEQKQQKSSYRKERTSSRVGLSEAVYVPKKLAADLKKTPAKISVEAAQEKLRLDKYRVTVTGFPNRADADAFKAVLLKRGTLKSSDVASFGSSLSGREELRLSPLASSAADKICKSSFTYGYVCSYVPLLD